MLERRYKVFALVCLEVAGVLMNPTHASAHLVTTGLGPVYDGIGHLLLSPEDLIPALMLALYAGLCGPNHGRRVVLILPPAWLIGSAAAAIRGGPSMVAVAPFSFVLLGGLVATDLRLPVWAVAGLAAMLGLGHGMSSRAALHDGIVAASLVGPTLALFVLVSLVSGFGVSLRRRWAMIVVRVAGSWVAASGVLMFGWLAAGAG